MTDQKKTILILGGGFGGIKTAQELAKKKLDNTRIVLISNKPHFEYHATLYRVLSGHSPLQVCIPLRDLFEESEVEVIEDTVTEINLEEKRVKSLDGFDYHYDTLVLALGAEPAYYDTPGLQELSYSIDSISSVLKLKNHLHEIFSQCTLTTAEENTCFANFVIVGGGVTGCETAGELAIYTKKLAKQHGIDPSFISIELIHAGSRLVPLLPEKISKIVEQRLRHLGVNILLNRLVVKEDVENVYMKDMMMKTKTLIWTAGVTTNSLFKKIEGLHFDKRRRVLVDEYLQAIEHENVFVIGDAASTEFTGMAQTALDQGSYVAETIFKKLNNKTLEKYVGKKPDYAIPLGGAWAATLWKGKTYYGKTGWVLRKLADFNFFRSVLPLSKALVAFKSEGELWETCPICAEAAKLQTGVAL